MDISNLKNWEVVVEYGTLGDEEVVSGIFIRDTDGEWVADVAECDDDLDDESLYHDAMRDAHLIAAAPLMYRVLRKIQNLNHPNGRLDPDWLEKILDNCFEQINYNE